MNKNRINNHVLHTAPDQQTVGEIETSEPNELAVKDLRESWVLVGGNDRTFVHLCLQVIRNLRPHVWVLLETFDLNDSVFLKVGRPFYSFTLDFLVHRPEDIYYFILFSSVCIPNIIWNFWSVNGTFWLVLFYIHVYVSDEIWSYWALIIIYKWFTCSTFGPNNYNI